MTLAGRQFSVLAANKGRKIEGLGIHLSVYPVLVEGLTQLTLEMHWYYHCRETVFLTPTMSCLDSPDCQCCSDESPQNLHLLG